MIDYITGKPRTGKSYRAMKYILDNFFDENKTPPYRNIITNIGGFQFEYLNKKFESLGRPNRAYKLIYKDFLAHIKIMHKMAFDGKEDEELIKYADYHKINDSLIVLDEAMLFLKKLDDSMSWFFSYHGHFKVRMIIMCQHPKQVHADYKIHTEFFIHAQPQSKQLSNNSMRYLHYDNPELKDSHSSDSIKTNPEVFKLYKSGEVDKPKKILYKYIFIGIFLLLVLFGVFYTLFSRIAPDIPNENNSSTSFSNTNDYDFESKINLINIRCDSQYCWNASSKYEDTQITKTYLKFVILENDLILKYKEVKNEIFKLIPQHRGQKKITLASFTDYYYDIPKNVQNEYLSTLFIPVKVESQTRSLQLTNPFSIESEAVTKNDERISEE